MYHNKHDYYIEVYQALLSIVLTHVQVMLNICTTVSSATRATTKGKKILQVFLHQRSRSAATIYSIQKHYQVSSLCTQYLRRKKIESLRLI